ncbi:unnamed protein product [Gadus morhua 'NCC']
MSLNPSLSISFCLSYLSLYLCPSLSLSLSQSVSLPPRLQPVFGSSLTSSSSSCLQQELFIPILKLRRTSWSADDHFLSTFNLTSTTHQRGPLVFIIIDDVLQS